MGSVADSVERHRATGADADPDATAVPPLVALTEAVDRVLASGLCPASGHDVAAVLGVLEREQRRLHSAYVEVADHVDRGRLHRADGHPNVKVQMRHVGRLPNGEALARSKTIRMFRELPHVRAALAAGTIGIAQVQLLARVHANPRISPAMELRQARFVEQARTLPYREFEQRLREWERLIDEDGPEPENERTHRRRSARLVQDPIDLSWELAAKYAAMQGMAMSEIFDHYIDAEWQADWDKAVVEHGDSACTAHMPRSNAQRRADALWQIFQDAAGADGTAVPPGYTHTIVWTADTYEEMLRRLGGAEPEPIDPDRFTCRSRDGIRLDPAEAAANSLLHGFRRLVVGADGVTLDAGRKRRFTGILRDIVGIQSGTTCVWPGCAVPVSRCEADHAHDHATGGTTDARNGDPLCGWHNRWKQTGYRIHRDPTGTWHTYRPDGTEIPL